jgi:hypothetical protein
MNKLILFLALFSLFAINYAQDEVVVEPVEPIEPITGWIDISWESPEGTTEGGEGEGGLVQEEEQVININVEVEVEQGGQEPDVEFEYNSEDHSIEVFIELPNGETVIITAEELLGFTGELEFTIDPAL